MEPFLRGGRRKRPRKKNNSYTYILPLGKSKKEPNVRHPPQSGWLDEWGCSKAAGRLTQTSPRLAPFLIHFLLRVADMGKKEGNSTFPQDQVG
jgi:hypothetical protein